MEFWGETLRYFPLDVLVSCLQPSVGPVDLTFGKSKEPLCGIPHSPPDRLPVARNNFDSPNSDRQLICERCHQCKRNRCLFRAYYTAISCEWRNYMGYLLSFMFFFLHGGESATQVELIVPSSRARLVLLRLLPPRPLARSGGSISQSGMVPRRSSFRRRPVLLIPVSFES